MVKKTRARLWDKEGWREGNGREIHKHLYRPGRWLDGSMRDCEIACRALKTSQTYVAYIQVAGYNRDHIDFSNIRCSIWP